MHCVTRNHFACVMHVVSVLRLTVAVCQAGRQICPSGASRPWSGWTSRCRPASCLTPDAAGCTLALSPRRWQTKTELRVKNVELLFKNSTTRACLYLVLLSLFQRLGDPLQPLLVRKLRPLFAKTIFNVFGRRLVTNQENRHSGNTQLT